MKKLGLIGGIGPESTLLYYKKLVYLLQNKFGPTFFPNLTIESLNVFDVLAFCENKDFDGLISYLMKGINSLIASGAEVVALTGNTPHIVFDQLQARSSVPLISIVEATKDAAKHGDYARIGLLGTKFTMQAEFFKKPFIDAGIAVIAPHNDEQLFIAEKISKELEHGIVSADTRKKMLQIVQRMHDEDNIEAIVLGCTELPLIFKDSILPIPTLDTLEIHIQELIRAIEY